MLAWYRHLRMTPKIVLPVTIVLVVILSFLTWQIQSKSSQAIESVAKRELSALAAQNGNFVRSLLNMAVNEAGALADSLDQSLKKGVIPSRETLMAMEEGLHLGNPELFGCGVMWEPNAFDGKDEAYRGVPGSNAEGRFLSYSSAGAAITDLGDQLEKSYYTVPKKTLAPYLSDPYPYHGQRQAHSHVHSLVSDYRGQRVPGHRGGGPLPGQAGRDNHRHCRL